MSKRNFIPIDEKKFTRRIKKAQLTVPEISGGIGCTPSGLRQMMKRGSIAPAYALAMESVYGISPDMYAPDPEPVFIPAAPEPETGIDYNMLEHIITRALDAVLKLYVNEMGNILGQLVAGAVTKAVHEVFETDGGAK